MAIKPQRMHQYLNSSIDIAELIVVAREAGQAIMNVYSQAFEFETKLDGSPITLADKSSNDIINNFLTKTYNIPIISEENEEIPYSIRKDWKTYWLIDPLDGTKEFVNKRREFTVNIALIEDNSPVIGIVYAPVFQDMFWAEKGKGCYMEYKGLISKITSHPKIKINTSKFSSQPHEHLKVILSRSHNSGVDINNYLEKPIRNTIQTISMGSSLKFCRLAQGNVDVYIRNKPTMEWDTAAAQIIVEESGRQLLNLENKLPLQYNKENLKNPSFIAF